MIKGIVTHIAAPGPDIRIVSIKPETSYTYKAGQYTNITFGGFDPRPFSIANAPQSGDDQMIELHVRTIGEGVRAHIGENLQIGDSVTLSPPQGDTIYQENCTRPILAIAGGIGLSGLKAVMEEAARRNHPAPLYLYFGGRTLSDLYALDSLKQLQESHENFKLVTALSDEQHDEHYHGLIGDIALADHSDLSAYRLYLGGPPAMINALAPALHTAGAHINYTHCDMPLPTLHKEENHG